MIEIKELKAGVGRHDITPSLGTLLAGYADPYEKRKAEKVHDPLHATALVLESGDERAAVVSVDVSIIEDRHVEQIRQGIESKTGISSSHVSVCAIQTHSAPRTQKVWGWGELDIEYVEGLMVPGAIEAVEQAWTSRVRARLGIGTVQSKVGVNRRALTRRHEVGSGRQNSWGLYDPEMTVLRFESASGALVNVVHYGAHPTVLGGNSKVISRDWPGIMIDRMEQLTGAPTIYINGAVGDIAPRSNSNKIVGDGEVALWESGTMAAMDAMAAWRSIKDMRDVELHCLVGSFELPYRPLPAEDEARKRLEKAREKKDEPGAGMLQYRYLQAVIEAHKGVLQTGKTYKQIITVLGPVALVPFPGEPFAETVLRLREWSPFQYTLCASTSCGNNGYFPTRDSLHRGGYETWVGKALGAYQLAENIDDVLVEENLKLLKEAHERSQSGF